MSTERYGLLDPAILNPDQHAVIGRIILNSLRSRLELPYWILALMVSGWIAWRSYARDTLPYLPCDDGHCSDPGTREWLNAVREMNAHASDYAWNTFIACVLIAAALRIAALIWGSILVAIYGDIRAESA